MAGMNFKWLEMVEKSTGKRTVLFDGEKFQNFDYLEKLVGREYTNLNDDLMDGISESNGYRLTREHQIYKSGELAETLVFEYEPDAVEKIRALYDDSPKSSVLDIESEDGTRLENVYTIGNDECYSGDEFFQYAVDENFRKVYRAFYEIPEVDGDTGINYINYSRPYRLEDVTEEFEN